eukprot:841944-Amphidinium_carterae.1
MQMDLQVAAKLKSAGINVLSMLVLGPARPHPLLVEVLQSDCGAQFDDDDDDDDDDDVVDDDDDDLVADCLESQNKLVWRPTVVL